MDNWKGFVVSIAVVALITAGTVAVVSSPVAGQSSNTTGNSSDDTEFDDPGSVGGNTPIKDPSSFVNPDVTYKPPGDLTDSDSLDNGGPGESWEFNNTSAAGPSFDCGGSLLDTLLAGKGLNMDCRMSKWIYNLLFAGFLNFMQGILGWIVKVIFNTPAPAVNGNPAIFAEPTNAPWNSLWNLAMFKMLPIGLVIWAFIFLGMLATTSLLPLGPHGEYKRRQLNNKAVLTFFIILGSWGIGSAFLWLTKGITLAVVPSGDQLASDATMFLGTMKSFGIMALLIYLVGGVMALYFTFLMILRYVIAGVFMIALPVVIPLMMVDVGPMKYISNVIERFIDTSVVFILMTIPMALVFQGGYAVVNAINSSAQNILGLKSVSGEIIAALALSNVTGLLIFGVWILTALVPIILFREARQVQGFATSAMTAGRKASDRLKELSESEPSEGSKSNGPDYGPGAMRPDDILEGSEYQRSSNLSEFGGALDNGQAHASVGQSEYAGMLGRGQRLLGDPRDPNASPTPNRLDNGHPAASALPGGNGGGQTSSTGRWSQFTDRVGNVGNWMGNARSNLNDRINNAREMGDTVRENGGNFAAGVAGATAGFLGAGLSQDDADETRQNTTTSNTGGESTSRSTTGINERTTRSSQGGAESQSQSSEDGVRFREEMGEGIVVPKSTAGLPNHLDIGIITGKGFKNRNKGVETDTVVDGFSRMEDNYAEQGDVFVARDQESGQIYDLSEIESDQEPPERDHNRERREKQSARDVENARKEADD